MVCQFVCRDFTWKLQNLKFKSDMFLMPLGNYDMVLGIQWLSKLGSIKWDFKRMIMKFDVGPCRCVLKAVVPKGVG